MNIVDSILLLALLAGAVIGFKKGFIKTMVSLIGTILVIVISFKLKDPISDFMFKYLPFFNFKGTYEGLTALNILIYEAIAFILVFVFLSAILGIIINISGVIEKLLNVTIILGVFSKILGAIAGLLEMIAFSYIVLFALAQFNVTSNYVLESKVGSIILENTPILSHVAAGPVRAIEEIYELQEKYEDKNNMEKFNQEALRILVQFKVISSDKTQELIDSSKIKVGEYKIHTM